MGANVQVCWDKFCRYWDVEPRLVTVDAETPHLTAEKAVAACDENTIGVVAILGSTFDGSLRAGEGESTTRSTSSRRRRASTSRSTSTARRARSSRRSSTPSSSGTSACRACMSINTSGHKYGLVYPGVGWIIWRDADDLPEDLVFKVDYLGGEMPTFALNFSRPGAQVVAQYYNFLRLGFEGYRSIQQSCRDTAKWIATQFAAMGPFELVSDGGELPVFAVRLKDDVTDVHRVRRLRPAAHARLARSGVPHAPRHRGHGGAPRRGAQRLRPRPRGHAHRRSRARDRPPRRARRRPRPEGQGLRALTRIALAAERDLDLDLDRAAAGQRGDADRGAAVAAGRAEHVGEEPARAVDHRGLLLEAGRATRRTRAR